MELPDWLRRFVETSQGRAQDTPSRREQQYRQIQEDDAEFREYIQNPASRPEVARAASLVENRQQLLPAPPAPTDSPEDREAFAGAFSLQQEINRRATEPQPRDFGSRFASGRQAMSIPPQGMILLDAIAKAEGTDHRAIYDGSREREGYDTAYGGQRVEGLTEGGHPNEMRRIVSGPDVGKPTSAVNRYQFIGSTWNNAVRRLQDLGYDVTDQMTPENQDRVTWFHAAETYRRYLERRHPELARTTDLATDLLDPAAVPRIAAALSSEWASLPGGRQPRMSVQDFDRLLTRARSPLMDFLARSPNETGRVTGRRPEDFGRPRPRPPRGRDPGGVFLPQQRQREIR